MINNPSFENLTFTLHFGILKLLKQLAINIDFYRLKTTAYKYNSLQTYLLHAFHFSVDKSLTFFSQPNSSAAIVSICSAMCRAMKII